ncbi:ribulose-phosphate 3-epimerase [bacterium]|nr:ribulose-phosphate 3-epimerase [bacterium]
MSIKYPVISPSVLSADFYNLKADFEVLKASGITFLHHDIMDNHFVPNLTYGYPVIKSLMKENDFNHDLHFMVENPDRVIPMYFELNPRSITFHIEACMHPQRLLSEIRKNGIKAGIALNPATSVDTLKYLLDDLDEILIMSVNPGFSGQKFISSVKKKIVECVEMVNNRDIYVALDGGVDNTNIKEFNEMGIDYFVCGSAAFRDRKISENILKLNQALGIN